MRNYAKRHLVHPIGITGVSLSKLHTTDTRRRRDTNRVGDEPVSIRVLSMGNLFTGKSFHILTRHSLSPYSPSLFGTITTAEDSIGELKALVDEKGPVSLSKQFVGKAG